MEEIWIEFWFRIKILTFILWGTLIICVIAAIILSRFIPIEFLIETKKDKKLK